MKIVVRYKHKSFSVEVPEQGTLDDLKRILATQEEVVPTQVQIVFKRRVLTGNPKLKDTGITEGILIDLIISKNTFELFFSHPEELVLTTPPNNNDAPSSSAREAFLLREKIRMLMNMGYQEKQAKMALKLANGDVQTAASFLPLDDDKIMLIKSTRLLNVQDKPEAPVMHEPVQAETEASKTVSSNEVPDVSPSNIQVLEPPSKPEVEAVHKPEVKEIKVENKQSIQIPPEGSGEDEVIRKVREFLSKPKRINLIAKLASIESKQIAKKVKRNPEVIIELMKEQMAADKSLELYTPSQREAIKELTKLGISTQESISLLVQNNWNLELILQAAAIQSQSMLTGRNPMELLQELTRERVNMGTGGVPVGGSSLASGGLLQEFTVPVQSSLPFQGIPEQPAPEVPSNEQNNEESEEPQIALRPRGGFRPRR